MILILLQGWFQGLPIMGPPSGKLPYYSHTSNKFLWEVPGILLIPSPSIWHFTPNFCHRKPSIPKALKNWWDSSNVLFLQLVFLLLISFLKLTWPREHRPYPKRKFHLPSKLLVSGKCRCFSISPTPPSWKMNFTSPPIVVLIRHPVGCFSWDVFFSTGKKKHVGSVQNGPPGLTRTVEFDEVGLVAAVQGQARGEKVREFDPNSLVDSGHILD